MIRMKVLPCAGAMLAAVAALSAAAVGAEPQAASPVYGVTVPEGYRQWQLIAPALEGGSFNEIRAILGNAAAVEAYRAGTLPFPDGTVLVKLSWREAQSEEFPSATVPGAAAAVQVMIKDSRKYSATGGWGFGRFVDGKPTSEAEHRTCFACHEARVKGHDFVFTRYAH